MTHAPDLARRRLLFAGLAFGLVAPARATELVTYGPGVPDAGAGALLATGALALTTSLVALRRSPNPEVREFARSEIAEQRGINRALTGSSEPTVPLGPRGSAILDEARSLPGGLLFDRTYVARQIDGHRRLLGLAQGYAAGGPDPEVAEVAQGAIPLIRLHLSILGPLSGALSA